MSTPPITVILPVHNNAKTLASAIQSILDQTWTDFELFVLENGSTDDSYEVAKQFTDERIRVFQLGPVGFTGAMQHGLEQAKSPYLVRMDGDDIAFPTKLADQLAVAEAKPHCVLVGTSFALLTPFNHVFERLRIPPESRPVTLKSLSVASYHPQKRPFGRVFGDGCTLYRRDIALKVGGYDFNFTMGDVPLWLRMLQQGDGWELVQPYFLRRMHASSMTHTLSDQGDRVRQHYIPELMPKKMPARNRTPQDSTRQFWRSVCRLELLTGNRRTVDQAIERLAATGDTNGVKTFRRRRTLMALGGAAFYRYRNRHVYRHRPDWEGQFSNLL